MTSDSNSFLFPFMEGTGVSEPNPALMGIKAANLATMVQIGLPVPPGFALSTELGKRIATTGEGLSAEDCESIHAAVGLLESNLGRTFGSDENPLLISVRSGAAISMPGMMDTVLNLGLNSSTVVALAKSTCDERFAWDTYRRFVQSYSQVVLDLDGDDFEDILEEMRIRNAVESDAELPAEALKEITGNFLKIVEDNTGIAFPQDVYEQLDRALIAVFNSWNTPRAKRYRDMQNVSHEGGTAALIQAMVFGNRNERSCTGVYFTRNPSTGENKPYGEYMPNAQGEDVVSGIRTPWELTEEARAAAYSDHPSMEKILPDAYETLLKAGQTLEKQFSDMQEIEFTVEDDRLFLLQTRNGKRTPKAEMKIAVDLAEEGLISKQQAVANTNLDTLEAMLVSKVDAKSGAVVLTKGLPASPGAATGAIVFSSDEAVKMKDAAKPCILVRPETDPKDVHGMHAAEGILTNRGGMTSHAAVVARGMAKPCITAAMTLKIDIANQICSCAGRVMKAGEIITIDGGTGIVHVGSQPAIVPEPDGELAKLLTWQKELDS